MNVDNDILQEFLIEAGELFEQLGDQLVALEKHPEDVELLNAIFRAFHTIKGGAGFMKLKPMVEVCHGAEDIINLLRQGDRQVDSGLIDVVLKVLDVLSVMFEKIRQGKVLEALNPEILTLLEEFSRPEKSTTEQTVVSSNEEGENNSSGSEAAAVDMDDEYEALLDTAQMSLSDATRSIDSSGDLITEDEFEDLLDTLHGEGKHGVLGQESEQKITTSTSTTSDIITEEEFETALDHLHGKNKGPGSEVFKPSWTGAADENEAVLLVNKRVENIPEKEKPKFASALTETSVRVDTVRLDDIMNLVGELVLVRNRLSTLKQNVEQDEVLEAISTLELVTSDLQSSVMKTRMQPIKKVFSRFPRVVRDLARQLKKDIVLDLYGENTDLDKGLVEGLADPLVHLVRNAVDHGIESPEERFSKNKSRQGRIVLSAQQEGDQILVSVSDDGKGMDHKVLRRKAVENGLMTEDEANMLSEHEAFNLIFAPGFSTKSEISEVSGRGVGMDVVRTRITELNGNIEIDSSLGGGSVIVIRLPLTLAILPTLMVMVKGYQYALPLTNINEAFSMDIEHINTVDGQEVMRVRDKPLPMFYLSHWLVNTMEVNAPQTDNKVIVVQMGNQQFCLVVDNIIGQEEVVIKPLGTMLYNARGFSGATITGDGSIALILDLNGLMTTHAHNG